MPRWSRAIHQIVTRSHPFPWRDTSTAPLQGRSRQRQAVLLAASRILSGRPTGSLVLGDGAAFGEFWSDGAVDVQLSRLDIVGVPLKRWFPEVLGLSPSVDEWTGRIELLGCDPMKHFESHASQYSAVGRRLACRAAARVLCRFGTVIPVDAQLVDETNRGRLIGSETHDVGVSHKVTVMARMLRAIDPDIKVLPIAHDFPTL